MIQPKLPSSAALNRRKRDSKIQQEVTSDLKFVIYSGRKSVSSQAGRKCGLLNSGPVRPSLTFDQQNRKMAERLQGMKGTLALPKLACENDDDDDQHHRPRRGGRASLSAEASNRRPPPPQPHQRASPAELGGFKVSSGLPDR